MNKIHAFLMAACFICFSLSATAQNNLVTVAGNGQISYGGDGGPAVNAAENGPTGICVDTSGNIFIADSYNNVVRQINSAGIIHTIAGNGFGSGIGSGGYSGDGGPAIDAELRGPQGLAMDHSGNIYIADAGNHVVRKINPSGTITTAVGTGTAGNSGDGGPATAALLNFPNGLAIDDTGNLYVADKTACVIRKVNTSGVISTIAGTGVAGFSGNGVPAITSMLDSPAFITVDMSQNLLIADNANHRVQVINTAGIITTLAGTGTPGFTGDGSPATAAELNNPIGVAIDSSGIYITDNSENVIRKISTSGTITTIAGIAGPPGYSGDGGPATAAMLSTPCGIAIDGAGNIYVCNNRNNLIRKINPTGIISTISGTIDSLFCGDGGPALQAELDSPMAAAFDDSGNIYVADYGNNCLRVVRPSGTITTFAGNAPAGPGYSGDGGPATAARLSHPKGVATDSAGNVYIADAGNACLRVVRPSGTIVTFAGTPSSPGYSGDGGSALSARINDPNGIAIDSAGNVYFSDAANHRVRVVRPSGSITTFAGNGASGSSGDSGPATAAELVYPMGLAIDAGGNIYIADSGAARVRVVRPSGNITTFAGTGVRGFSGDGGPATSAQLTAPMGIVVDDSGNVHITDGSNARIRVVRPSGDITTYAGTGTPGFNGDGPDATTQLNRPVGLSKDLSGRLYVTDCNNDRVRRFIGVGGLGVTTATQTTTENLAVYPNPSKGTFILNFSTGANQQVHYVITNMLGQKIKDFDAATGQPLEMQLSAPPGIYLVTAVTTTSRQTVRIVIAP